MSNSNRKGYFRGLPCINLVSGLIEQVYEAQNDKSIEIDHFAATLLSVYRKGLKPGISTWKALKALHEYILDNGMIEENSAVSEAFKSSIKTLKVNEKRDIENDEVIKHDKKPNPKVEPKSRQNTSEKELAKKTRANSDNPAQDGNDKTLSGFQSFRIMLGKVLGPRDKQPSI